MTNRGDVVGLWSTVATLERAGRATARVGSSSMSPWLRAGARIAVVRCRVDELEPGEVAVVRAAGGPVVHRVIDRASGDRLVTRGDANRRPDAPVAPERVLGRVEGVVLGRRQWRSAPRALGRAQGRLALALAPLTRRVVQAVRRVRR